MRYFSMFLALSSATIFVNAQTIIDQSVGGKVDTMDAALQSVHEPFGPNDTVKAMQFNASTATRYFPDVYMHSVAKYDKAIPAITFGSVALNKTFIPTRPVFELTATKPVYNNQAISGLPMRSEVATLWDYAKEEVRWYAISVYIPTTFRSLSNIDQVIMQLHNSGFSPTVSVGVKNNELTLYLRTQTSGMPTDTINGKEVQLTQEQQIYLGPVDTNAGKWYCMVANVDWSPVLGRGSMDIFWNGKQVYRGINMANNYYLQTNGNYAKAGIYIPGEPAALPADFTKQTIYADFIHISNDPAMTNAKMKAKTPCV